MFATIRLQTSSTVIFPSRISMRVRFHILTPGEIIQFSLIPSSTARYIALAFLVAHRKWKFVDKSINARPIHDFPHISSMNIDNGSNRRAKPTITPRKFLPGNEMSITHLRLRMHSACNDWLISKPR